MGVEPNSPTEREIALSQEIDDLRRQLAAAAHATKTGESRLDRILESAIDYAIIALDLDGLVTFWSEGAHRTLGWTASEMLGRPASIFFTQEDRVKGIPQAEMQAALLRDRGSDERWHLRRDGSRFWANGEMMPLRDETGAIQGFVKVLRDRTEQRLAAERQRADAEFMRSVLAASDDCIKVLDLDAKLIFMSEGGKRVMEVSDFEAVRGCPWPDFWQGDDKIQAQAAVAAARAGGAGQFQGRADTLAGNSRWWNVQVTPIRDAEGRPEKLLAVSRDITAMRQADRAMKQTAMEFEALAENVSQLAWMAEPDGHVFWYNKRWYDYTGTDLESMRGWGWRTVHRPDQIDRVIRDITERWRAGLPFEEIYYLRSVDGTYRPFLTRVEPIRNESGDLVRWFGTNTDISAQLEAEQRLRELNETLEQEVDRRTRERNSLWLVSQDVSIVIDAHGQFYDINPATTEVLGWSFTEMVGRSVFDFTLEEDIPSTKAAVDQAARGSLRTFVNRYRHKDGSFRWLSWMAAPDADRIYATARDITAEKTAAAELAAAQEALRQSQKMEAVGQLTGGLAHDFNNLLTGIIGSLELIQTRIVQGRLADVDRYINAAQGASKRAAALTHRLLAFSRQQTLEPRPTNINRLVAGLEDLIRRTVGPSIEIEVVGAADLWTALVDSNQLENALLNLCINARDAMPEGGRITIETANKVLDKRMGRERDLPPGEYLALSVTDTGVGMTQDVIARAFDPFFTTKPIGQGTGLGLSMTYGFIRQSGGQVRVYSEVGMGTTMCLYLPRHHGEDSPDAGEAAFTEAARAGQGETVLVVDDEPSVRMLAAEVLEELGYKAIEVADGAAGLKVLQSATRVDLLVTDVGLPGGMNGRQLADVGRTVRPNLKVLFITGYAENAVFGNGHLDPGMHILTKPFAMDALANRIKDLISGG